MNESGAASIASSAESWARTYKLGWVSHGYEMILFLDDPEIPGKALCCIHSCIQDSNLYNLQMYKFFKVIVTAETARASNS